MSQFRTLAVDGDVRLNQNERDYLDASQVAFEQMEESQRRQQARELELAQEAAASAQRVAQSQRQAANRLRILVAALGLFLLIAGGLAVFAFNKQSEATANSVLAQSNYTRAETQRLAVLSNEVRLEAGSTEVAALLAIRSMRLQYSPEGDQALIRASMSDLPIKRFQQDAEAIGTVFTADGKFLLTGGYDKFIHIWDVQAEKEVKRLSGHTDVDWVLNITTDSRYILTGSYDNTVRLWDFQAGKEVRQFPGINGDLTHDGKYIAVGSSNNTVQLYDLATGSQIYRWTEPAYETIGSVRFSADDRTLVGFAATVMVWDVQTGRELHRFVTQWGMQQGDISPDGKLYAAATGGHLLLIDAQTGSLRVWVGHTNQNTGIIFSPDGKYLLSTSQDKSAKLWDVKTLDSVRQFVGHSNVVTGGAFSPDGKFIATASIDRSLLLWNLRQPNDGKTFPTQGIALLSPDSKLLLTNVLNDDKTDSLAVWDRQTGNQISTFYTGPSAKVFTPDSQYLVTGNSEQMLRIWNVKTGDEVRRFVVPWWPISIDITSDGTRILVAPNDSGAETRLLNFEDGLELRRWTGQPGSGHFAAFSPDMKSIVTVSSDPYFRTWDVQTGALIRQFDLQGALVNQASFSPDGKVIAVGGYDGVIRLFDVQTGMVIRRLIGHTEQVLWLSFSPDGQYVLSGAADNTARLWAAANGRETRRFVGLLAAGDLHFSSDGRYVLMGGDDQFTHMWDVDYHDALQGLCARLVRDFTSDERAQYSISDDVPTCPADASAFGPTQTPPAMPTLPIWTPLPTVILPTFPPEPTDIPTENATQSATQASGG